MHKKRDRVDAFEKIHDRDEATQYFTPLGSEDFVVATIELKGKQKPPSTSTRQPIYQ